VPVMLASDLGALLVVSHEKLLGIVTERDLMQALARLLADKG
jgi:CBS domain-containing protein